MNTHPDIEKWKSLASKQCAEGKLSDLDCQTPEGIVVKPIYTAEDLDALEHLNGLPGIAPYVRGPMATMYAGRPWTIRQYAGFSTAKESNAFYRRNLAAGQMGLSVAFDLPTHRGYDSDHPRVVGDVGKAGVAIDSVEDMKILFDQIPLDQMSVSMTMNGAVIPILGMYIVAAEEQGVKHEQLSGTIQNDILKEYLTRNTYIYPPEPSMRIVSDIIAFCSKNMPRFNTISISGYHMMEAGATSLLQLAFTLADGLEYVRAALKAGLDIDEFAPRLSFFFGVGMNFFMEIAMLRAARFLWHELVSQFNPKNPKSTMLRTHVQTSGWSLTAQDPYNNIIRTTIEAMAAALGGTQSLHTNAFDEAIGLPTDFSARIARNTQIIIQEESQICHVIDPLAGSYYVEALTAALIREARKSDQGGGGPGRHGQGHRNRDAQDADRGVGRPPPGPYRSGTGCDRRRQQISYAGETAGRRPGSAGNGPHGTGRALKRIRATRNDAAVRAALADITKAARRGGICWKPALPAVRLRATVGEISDALESVFGRFVATTQVISGVYASEYRIRLWSKNCGREPMPFSRRKEDARGFSWPKWDRTDMTGAPRWWPRPLPTSASTWISAPCSRLPKKRPKWQWKTMFTLWASPPSPPGTRPWFPSSWPH